MWVGFLFPFHLVEKLTRVKVLVAAAFDKFGDEVAELELVNFLRFHSLHRFVLEERVLH